MKRDLDAATAALRVASEETKEAHRAIRHLRTVIESRFQYEELSSFDRNALELAESVLSVAPAPDPAPSVIGRGTKLCDKCRQMPAVCQCSSARIGRLILTSEHDHGTTVMDFDPAPAERSDTQRLDWME